MVQCGVLCCVVLWRGVEWCLQLLCGGAVRSGAERWVLNGVLRHGALCLCAALQCSAVWWSAIRCTGLVWCGAVRCV